METTTQKAMEIANDALKILEIPLSQSSVETRDEIRKFYNRLHVLVPRTRYEAKKQFLLADTVEKNAILETKKRKLLGENKMTDQDIRAYARSEANKAELVAIELEEQANYISNVYEALKSANNDIRTYFKNFNQ